MEFSVRVLLFNRDHSLWQGGDVKLVEALQAALQSLGVDAIYSHDPDIDLGQFDVVHLFHLNFRWSAGMAQRCIDAGVPYVICAIYFPEVREVAADAMRRMVDHAHVTFVNSTAERALIASATGVDPARMTIIPNGIDPAIWQRGRRRNGPALTFARLTPDKGLLFAARACRELGVPYVVFGPSAGHPQYEADLRALGARLLGPQRQPVLATAARAASLYICTSLSDVQSLSVLEAAQCGLPIVDSIYNPGSSFLPSSIVVDPRDHDAVVDAIRIQRAAPDNTDRVLSWEDVARQMLAAYPRVDVSPA